MSDNSSFNGNLIINRIDLVLLKLIRFIVSFLLSLFFTFILNVTENIINIIADIINLIEDNDRGYNEDNEGLMNIISVLKLIHAI